MEYFATDSAGYWWREKDLDVHGQIFSYIQYLEKIQAVRRWEDRIHEAIYTNQVVTGGGHSAALSLLRGSGYNTARLNVARNMVDAVVAKVASKNPAVKANPHDADWSTKVKARDLTKFIRGKLAETDFDELDDSIVRDACIYGTGIVKIVREHGEIKPMRVRKEEIFVDNQEARYGSPRQMHHRMQFAREVAKEMFPEHAGLIEAAPAAKISYDMRGGDDAEGETNMIWLTESWHLPSGPDANDGAHAICTENATLLMEDWDRPRFPFSFLHWSPPVWGFWGRGICEEVGELQWKINEVAAQIQEAISWARLIVFTQRGAAVNKAHLGARHPHIIEYTGAKPEFEMPNVYSAQMLQFLDWLVQQAYDVTGISRMSAQARKPAGLESGRALEEWYDIESERFATFEQAYGLFRVRSAESYIDEAKVLDEEREDGYSAAWADRGLMEKINWKDVDLSRDQFKLGLEPASFLPDTRAGKFQAIEQLSKVGIATERWVPSLFDAPDVARFFRVQNAPFNAVERHMEMLMREDRELPQPDAFTDLQLALDHAVAYLQDCEADDSCPDEVRERFREYITLVEGLLKQSQPPVPTGMPGDPVAAAGPPAAPGMLPPAAAPEALGAPGEGLAGV